MFFFTSYVCFILLHITEIIVSLKDLVFAPSGCLRIIQKYKAQGQCYSKLWRSVPVFKIRTSFQSVRIFFGLEIKIGVHYISNYEFHCSLTDFKKRKRFSILLVWTYNVCMLTHNSVITWPFESLLFTFGK